MVTAASKDQAGSYWLLGDLRARIDAGEWDHGEQMPATREVADQYRVSSRTAAKAYRILADEGLVIVRPSWGTHRALSNG
jgi:GntR family transcriptional regulator